MKWRKYPEEKPELNTFIIIRCNHVECEDCLEKVFYTSLPEHDIDEAIFCYERQGMDSGHGIKNIKYWIPLSELEATLPKDIK